MAEAKNIIRFSRSKTIAASRSEAVLSLDSFSNRVGQPVIVRYYRDYDNDPTEIDLILAVGLADGTGRDTYKIIFSGCLESLIEDVWTTPGEYPDVSLLAHSEVYIVTNEEGILCYCYALNDMRYITPIDQEGEFRYINLTDGFVWYYKGGAIRSAVDFYSQKEVDEKLSDVVLNVDGVEDLLIALMDQVKEELNSQITVVEQGLDLKIDTTTRDLRSEISSTATELGNRISDVDTSLSARIEETDTQIRTDMATDIQDSADAITQAYTDLVTTTKTELSQNITEVNTRVTNLDSQINTKVDNLDSRLDAKIDNSVDELNNTITVTYNTLNSKIDNTTGALDERVTDLEDSRANFEAEIRRTVETLTNYVDTELADIKRVLNTSLSKIGVINYLKNSTFCGEYTTTPMNSQTPLTDDVEVYSDAAEYWDNVNAWEIVPEAHSQSGFAVKLSNEGGVLSQTITAPSFEIDENYVVSWKSKGRITVEIDGNSWTVDSEETTYYWKDIEEEDIPVGAEVITLPAGELPEPIAQYEGKYFRLPHHQAPLDAWRWVSVSELPSGVVPQVLDSLPTPTVDMEGEYVEIDTVAPPTYTYGYEQISVGDIPPEAEINEVEQLPSPSAQTADKYYKVTTAGGVDLYYHGTVEEHPGAVTRSFYLCQHYYQPTPDIYTYHTCLASSAEQGFRNYRYVFQYAGNNQTFSAYGSGYICEPKVEIGNVGTAWFLNALDTPPVAARFNDYSYLLSSLPKYTNNIALRNTIQAGQFTNSAATIKSGISGSYNGDTDAYFWSGSTYEKAQQLAELISESEDENWYVKQTDLVTDQLTPAYINFGGKSVFGRLQAKGAFRGLLLDSTGREVSSRNTHGLSGIHVFNVINSRSVAANPGMMKFENGYIVKVYDNDAMTLPEAAKIEANLMTDTFRIDNNGSTFYDAEGTSVSDVKSFNVKDGLLIGAGTLSDDNGLTGVLAAVNGSTTEYLVFYNGRLVMKADNISAVGGGKFLY